MNNESVKCPYCGSENVCLSKRGYSVLLGLLGLVIVFLVHTCYWIISSGYADQTNEITKNVMITMNQTKLIFVPFLGLLLGFAGSGKIKGKCLNCKKHFSI